jgi:ATP-dependent protease ClpP protease subunit
VLFRSILADATGQSGARIREDLASHTALSAEEAIDYGLVHRIIARSDR